MKKNVRVYIYNSNGGIDYIQTHEFIAAVEEECYWSNVIDNDLYVYRIEDFNRERVTCFASGCWAYVEHF